MIWLFVLVFSCVLVCTYYMHIHRTSYILKRRVPGLRVASCDITRRNLSSHLHLSFPSTPPSTRVLLLNAESNLRQIEEKSKTMKALCPRECRTLSVEDAAPTRLVRGLGKFRSGNICSFYVHAYICTCTDFKRKYSKFQSYLSFTIWLPMVLYTSRVAVTVFVELWLTFGRKRVSRLLNSTS
jgi:hypothetical protein